MRNKCSTAAFAAVLALAASAPAAQAQKALVYCPVSVDAGGCDRIVSALKSKFADSVDRGFDGSSGTVDLRKIDLQHYAVFVVPSLADDAAKQPYAVLRSAATRLHMAINGRVAVYSGAPDQGAANRADKDALIQNLTRWAADGHNRATGLVGLVAFLDLSEKSADRYSWVRSISAVDVSADEELQASGEITPVTTRGGDMFSASGRTVKFSNMASYGLHIGGHAAARTEVSAMGGASSRQSILVQYSNAGDDVKATSGGSTGKIGSSGASFNISSGTSASMSTTSTGSGPTLATDKPDYQPGDTVTFSGTGWVAGDTVTITIHEDPQWTTEDRTVTAVADGTGNFTNHTFVVDQRDYGVTFTATAVANPSGLVAQMTFTDSKPNNISAINQTPNPVVSGSSATYTVTIGFNGNSSTCTAALSAIPTASPAWPAPPTGGFFAFAPSSVTSSGSNQTSALTVKTNGMAPNTYHFTITATPDASCQSPSNPVVSSSIDLVVIAPPTQTLTITGSGAGVGSVTSSPAGINCTTTAGTTSGTCSFAFAGGAAVTLTASPSTTLPTAAGSTFDAWSGDGTGTTTRGVTMDAPRSVAAAFKANQTTTFTSTAPVGAVYGGTYATAATGGGSGNLVTFGTSTPSVCTASGSTVTFVGVGTCTVTADQLGNASYNAAPQATQSFSVAAKPLTVTFTAADKVYDGTTTAAVSACVIATGKVGTDDVTCSVAGGTFASANASASAQVVSATATLGGAAAANYTVTNPVTSSAKINPKLVTVTFTAADKEYDATNVAAVSACVIATGKVGTDDVTCSVAGGTFATIAASATPQVVSATATLGGGAAGNYVVTNPVTSSAKINAKTITITPNSGQSKIYGATDPALTFAPTPALLGSDSFTGALGRASGENVGNYAITLGTLSAGSNYSLTLSATTVNFAITAKPIVITPTSGQSKIYGAIDPALAYTPSPSLQGGDSFSGALGRAPGESVGTYAITLGTLSAGGNYMLSLSAAPVMFAVTAKTVTVTFTASDKVYDGTNTASVSGCSILTGKVGSDDVTCSVAGGTFATANASASAQVVSATATLGGSTAGNYTVTNPVSSSARINPKAVTVTFAAADKEYDGTNTASVSACAIATGKVGSDDVTCSVAGGTFASVNASASPQVVSATATLAGGAAGNYTVTNPVTSSAKISAKPVTITPTSGQSKTYGDADPTLTFAASPVLFEGDTFTGALSRAPGTNVGAYAIMLGTLSAGPNYALTLSASPVNFTINAKPITITPNSGQTKVYGYADPVLTYSPTPSLLGGDSFNGALSRASGENVGPYAITLGTLSAGTNYNLSLAAAPVNFTITARTVTVTFSAADKVYDGSNTAAVSNCAIATGKFGADDVNCSVAGGAFASPNASASAQVVSATATLGGSTAGNYTVTNPVTSSAKIGPRAVSVIFAAADKMYDGTNTAAVSGCSIATGKVGNDDVTCSVASGTFASANASASAQVVSATASLGGSAAGNYSITNPVSATAHITTRPITVTPTAPDLTWTGSPLTPDYSYVVSVNTVISGDQLGTAIFSPATVTNVGTYTVSVSGLANSNYDITPAFGAVNVVDHTNPNGAITELNPVPLGTAATLKVNISDVTTGNSNIIAWKYSIDGVDAAPISISPASQTPNANLSASIGSFNTTDVKQVCIQGEDAGLNWSPVVCALLAVYDPSAGFVTGGGWIVSPAGAYAANPSLTGRANFGFVSKYQKGANVPTGNTEFQFQEANLNFHSTSFAWLVISGTTQAQFKGTGTINGSGNYNFLVTAIDGDNFNGTKKPDGFRIKITDAAGNVVYDNQMGADDTSSATTAISGGSIQIQSK